MKLPKRIHRRYDVFIYLLLFFSFFFFQHIGIWLEKKKKKKKTRNIYVRKSIFFSEAKNMYVTIKHNGNTQIKS